MWIKGIPKTDVRFGYDFNRSRGRYLYVLPPNSTLVTPQQLPEVLNELHRATVDLKYFFARHLAAGVVYWTAMRPVTRISYSLRPPA